VLKSPALLARTYKRNGGWRVTAFIEKRNVHGPLRTTEAQAEEDLAAARTKASHQEFRKFLRDLASSASEAAAVTAAAASSRGSDVPECATGQPTGLESAAATPRKRCRIKSPAKPRAAREHQDTASAAVKQMPAGEWHRMPVAEASADAVCMRGGVASDELQVFDVMIPPLSKTISEHLAIDRELMFSILHSGHQKLVLLLNGRSAYKDLSSGDFFVVRGGEHYQLDNTSSIEPTHLRMVIAGPRRQETIATTPIRHDAESVSPESPLPTLDTSLPGLLDEDGDLCLDRRSKADGGPQFRGHLYKPGVGAMLLSSLKPCMP
jgi:mannose-6-phosphate isomerase-like protein (cupin superfamily)